MTTAASGHPDLLETIETQRLGCELAGSPLYAEILAFVAADVRRHGPIARVLEPVAAAPFGDAVLLRFMAALHRLVLEGRAPELAAHFPSVGGSPRRGLDAAVLATVEAHAGEIADQLGGGVQTNEVGRSASLVGGLLEVARLGLPLRLLEVGASAGLNLNVDRYRFEAGHEAMGPPESPLVFRDPWVGAAPDLRTALVVAERRGCDAAPIDPTTAAGELRLRSFVWADQAARLARLDAALSVARAHPPEVDRADAVAWTERHLATPRPGVATVVMHSIVLQYLGPDARSALLRVLEDAGRTATSDAPLAWLRLEPGGDQAELRLTIWPDGTTQLLATSAYHGPPVVWRAPARGAGREGHVA